MVENLRTYSTQKLRSLILGCVEKSKKEEVRNLLSIMDRDKLQETYIALYKQIKSPIRLARKLTAEEFYDFAEIVSIMQTLVYKIDLMEEHDAVFRGDLKNFLNNGKGKVIEALNTYMKDADMDFYKSFELLVDNCEASLLKARNNIIFK